MSSSYDCQACGACCVNMPANRAQGVTYWVELSPSDRLLTRRDLLRKHVTYDRQGVPHLRMAPDGRCLALHGDLGDDVTCSIYRDRPSPCRRVQAGDETCLRSRAAHGIA